MNIHSFVKNSFVDYPHQIASVIFTSGCNFDCWYCQNQELIKTNQNNISETSILDYLQSRVGMIDAVVISGGEPTLQADLIPFAERIKAMGFLLKLDTNGSNPEIIKQCLEKDLFEYYAMDIKCMPQNYKNHTKIPNIEYKILESISIIQSSGKSFEFRTTFEPKLSLIEIEQIAKLLSNKCDLFAIQQYRPINEIDKDLNMPHSFEEIQKALNISKKYIENVILRNI